MWLFNPEVITAFATFMAAIAASMSAYVAWRVLKHDKFREQNRISFLKNQSEIEHIQKLIASFVEVMFLESLEWGDERSHGLDKAIQTMRFHVSSLESLNAVTSTRIAQWVREKSPDGKEVSQVIYYELGQSHVITGGKHREFMQLKLEELKDIQDTIFYSMAATDEKTQS